MTVCTHRCRKATSKGDRADVNGPRDSEPILDKSFLPEKLAKCQRDDPDIGPILKPYHADSVPQLILQLQKKVISKEQQSKQASKETTDSDTAVQVNLVLDFTDTGCQTEEADYNSHQRNTAPQCDCCDGQPGEDSMQPPECSTAPQSAKVGSREIDLRPRRWSDRIRGKPP
jgi:hypothetical protein